MAEPETTDGTTVVQVSCGSSHTVALLDCNLVASWGRGEDGQLGHGDAEQIDTPKAVHSLLDKDISSVCCGAEYTLAVSNKRRQVYSWGWGDFGRLGHGDCTDVFVPQQISFFNNIPIKQVACGDTHTLVATESGELFTFGRNQNGQLGHGNTNDLLAPKQVEELKGKVITSVAAGAEHTVVATQDGEVYAWGWGRYGNLGDGERLDRHAPARVHNLEGVPVTHVACGWRHSAAIDAGGRVFTWGWSKYGQLGHGDNDDRLIACEVSRLSGVPVLQIAGGWRHTMALDQEGNVWAWGWNKFGQLGIGHTDDQNSPVLVDALKGHPMALVACGWRHTVSVGQAGEVFSWGRGVNGQLGHGQEVDEFTPKTLTQLCKGTASRQALRATATALGGYVAPADRYAVVPNGDDEVMEVPGAAAAVGSADDLVVPGQSDQDAAVMDVSDAAAGSNGCAGGGGGVRVRPAADETTAPAAKKAHTLAAAGTSFDDAAVPGS